ncbi:MULTISPECIES: hypothetical protein [unclassified Pseudomonas]|nr:MULTISPECIES: hypothetical protein [unclassified Pseudomonas]
MRKGFNVSICVLTIVAFCILFFGVPVAGVYSHPRIATYAAFLSCFVLFLMLLEMRQDRVLKGVFLIGAGVLYQVVYPKFFYIFVDKSIMPSDAVDHFEIFGQVISLACAGAGGSIIAAYADKTSSDNEQALVSSLAPERTVIERTVIDNTLHIKQLVESNTTLSKKITALAVVVAVMLVVVMIGAMVLLFR